MDKNGLLIVLLLLFITVLGRTDALSSRKLVSTSDPNTSSNAIQDSSLPSAPVDKKSNPTPVEETKPDDSPNKNPSNVEAKGLNNTNTKTNPENSTDKKTDKGKSPEEKEKEKEKEKVETQIQLETFANKSCNGNPICTDKGKTMVACIQDFENGSNNLTVAVQNEIDKDLTVNITFGTLANDISPAFQIPGHATKKVNLTFSWDKTTKLYINAGNGDCELSIAQLKVKPIDDPSKSKDPEKNPKQKDMNDPANTPTKPKEETTPTKPKKETNPTKPKEETNPTNPKKADTPTKPKKAEDPSNPDTSTKDIDTPGTSSISETNFLDQVSVYSKQVTPMHGAYFAFFVVLVIGGSWAMCSFRKRRTDGGVAYQELEMGIPETSNDVEPVEGWEQDWDDDDWDEDKAIRSPGGGVRTETISSNGLTSRGVKKDGWDADWDD